jgi:hypothetical protein
MLLTMNGGEREHKTRAAEPFDAVVGGCPLCDVIRYLISMIEFTWAPPRLFRRSRTERVVVPNAKD